MPIGFFLRVGVLTLSMCMLGCSYDSNEDMNSLSPNGSISDIYASNLEDILLNLTAEQVLQAAEYMDTIPEYYYDSLGYYHNRLILDAALEVSLQNYKGGPSVVDMMIDKFNLPRELQRYWQDPNSFNLLNNHISAQDLRTLDSLKTKRLEEAVLSEIWWRSGGSGNPAMATAEELSLLKGPLARVMYRHFVSIAFYSSHLWYPDEDGQSLAHVLSGTLPSSTIRSRIVGDCFSLGYSYSCCGDRPRSQCTGPGGNGGSGPGPGPGTSGSSRCQPPPPDGYYQGNCAYPPCQNCMTATLRSDALSATGIAVGGFIYWFIISELLSGGTATVPNIGYVATTVGTASTLSAINCNISQSNSNPNCLW